MFAVFYELAFVGRRSAKALGSDVHRVYMHCGVLTLFMWMLYPISWGLCEGGNVITANDEALFYGILDLIAKPVCFKGEHVRPSLRSTTQVGALQMLRQSTV